MKSKFIILLLFVLSVPVLAKAEEEQADFNIFQQYEQTVVRLHDYSQDDNFMNPFMWGFGPMGFYGRGMHHYRHYSNHNHNYNHHGHHDYERRGGVYFGPNFWSDNRSNNPYLRNLPETTLVDPSEYSFQPEK